MVGATPVFSDIEPVSFNLDVSQIEKRITSKTKAVIPVHLYGEPVDMEPLLALAQKHGLKVLEDVAQAMGALYDGKKLGGLGEIGAFSFYPSKNLGGFGDGGLMTTQDDSLAETCRLLRVHGSKKAYFNEVIGYNSRLDELQAAFLRVKLKYLEETNEARRQVARRYEEAFMGVDQVVTPKQGPRSKHVFHQYTVRVPAEKRDTLHRQLAAQGISTMLYYPVPLHRLPVYQAMGHAPLPQTDQASKEVISLPMGPFLSVEAQLEVVAAVKQALN
jgi:dTDP-4-amino-4,6-dideoxygalactose transaminase